jgi:hypothetical protein
MGIISSLKCNLYGYGEKPLIAINNADLQAAQSLSIFLTLLLFFFLLKGPSPLRTSALPMHLALNIHDAFSAQFPQDQSINTQDQQCPKPNSLPGQILYKT